MARAEQLVERFDQALAEFDERRPFSGPSVYFHEATIAHLRAHPDPGSALEDDVFTDYIYATLTAWGMHRLGSGGAKLAERVEFATAVRRRRASVSALSGVTLCDIEPVDLDTISWALQYIYGSSGKTPHMGDQTAFEEITPALHCVATGARDQVEAALAEPGRYMITSVGKVIDNAIVGAMLGELTASPGSLR